MDIFAIIELIFSLMDRCGDSKAQLTAPGVIAQVRIANEIRESNGWNWRTWRKRRRETYMQIAAAAATLTDDQCEKLSYEWRVRNGDITMTDPSMLLSDDDVKQLETQWGIA